MDGWMESIGSIGATDGGVDDGWILIRWDRWNVSS